MFEAAVDVVVDFDVDATVFVDVDVEGCVWVVVSAVLVLVFVSVLEAVDVDSGKVDVDSEELDVVDFDEVKNDEDDI